MTPEQSSISYALRHLDAAARAWLDGPGVALRRNVDRSVQVDYSANDAAADLGRLWSQSLRAWGISAARMSDALALLAMPPTTSELHCVTLPPDVPTSGALEVILGPNAFTLGPTAIPSKNRTPVVVTLVEPPAGSTPDQRSLWFALTPLVRPSGSGGTLTVSIGWPGVKPRPFRFTLKGATLRVDPTSTVP